MIRHIIIVFLFSISAPAATSLAHAAPGCTSGQERDRLDVLTARGRIPFAVELALTPEEQQKGLMQRDHLAADAGMLFVMPQEKIVRMWMKDTLIPLDMLFIDKTGHIASIHSEAPPLSLDLVESARPVIAVLELAGGTAVSRSIAPGDRVIHPCFLP